jgi:L-asparaginase
LRKKDLGLGISWHKTSVSHNPQNSAILRIGPRRSVARLVASAKHRKLGEIDDAAVVVSRRTIRQHPVLVAPIETRVDLVKACMGADGRFIDYTVETGSRALVVEAFGRGNTTLAMTEAVGRAVKRGTLVAVASRSPQGRVAPTYTGGGGAHDLKHAGAIFAGDLNGARTRVLLAVLLGA